jgi:hypothetical protein
MGDPMAGRQDGPASESVVESPAGKDQQKRLRQEQAELRARDAREAWREHEEKEAHVAANMARLKALRLAQAGSKAAAKRSRRQG